MKKGVLIISAVVCVAAVVCMICALTLQKKPVSNEFIPPDFDSAAQYGVPEVPDNMGYSELDAKAFRVAVCGKPVANNGKVDLYLTNPESNTVWLKVRLLDEKGTILGETGLIKPGEYVKSLTLDNVPQKSVAVKIKIMAYEPKTYFSEGAASLNTTLTIG